MAVIILIALGLAAAQLIRLYLFPFRACKRCGGTGRKHSRLNRRTFGLCTHCDATGRVLRPGARMVHRAALAARSPHARDRLRVRQAEATERTQTPGRTTPRAVGSPERGNP
jgi:hypothetical protein